MRSFAISMIAVSVALSLSASAQEADPYLAQDFMATCSKLLDSTAPIVYLDAAKPSSLLNGMTKVFDVEVIGQSQAVQALITAIEISLANIQDPNKPLGSYLFTGPTGVGKTETAKALVKALGGDPDRDLVRINGGEFQQGHEISRLTGATATYVGYGDKGDLHQEEMAKHQLKFVLADDSVMMINVVLVDEIEKAGKSLYNLLLAILDNGEATMGDKTNTNFRKTIVIGTTNLGAQEVEGFLKAKEEELLSKDQSLLSEEDKDLTGRHNESLRSEINDSYDAAERARFAPEFRNRWSERIQFLHLSAVEHRLILQKQLARLQSRIFASGYRKVGILVDTPTRDYLVKMGTDLVNGARPMENLLKRTLRKDLARFMVTGQVDDGDLLRTEISADGKIRFRIVARDLDKKEFSAFGESAFPGYGFADFDWDGEKAKQKEKDSGGPVKEKNLVEQMNLDGGKVVRSLYLHCPVDGRRMAYGQQGQAMTIKYIMISETLYRLDMFENGNFKTSVAGEMHDELKDLYKDNLQTMDEKDVREMIAKHARGESL